MLANQGYAAYANNKIMTASPAELTLMLYEGAIKFANLAIMAIEENNVPRAHKNIMKVERIIEEFYKPHLLALQAGVTKAQSSAKKQSKTL